MHHFVLIATFLGLSGCVAVPTGDPSTTGSSITSHGTEPQVARILYNGQPLCLGLVLDTRSVLTAAHCTENRSGPLSAGALSADGVQVARYTVNPAWSQFRGDAAVQAGLDVALLRLEDPIPSKWSMPFYLDPLAPGTPLVLHLQSGAVRACPVLGQSGTVIELACRVQEGWSGAPLTVDTPSGPKIVGVLSGTGVGAQANIAVVTHAGIVSGLWQ